MNTLILAALVGIAVGIVVGALGAGGGIISVPVLVYLLAQDPHSATASSLVIVIMAALAGLPSHARRRHIQWKQGFLFASASLIGSVAGARASVLVPAHILLLIFSGLLVVVALIMTKRALRMRSGERRNIATAPRPPAPWWVIALAATMTGALTGFFGVGGGFAVVPVLTLVLGFTMIEAAGTSLLVMIIAALAGLAARFGTHVEIDWWLTILFGAGSMLGSALGAPLASRAKPWVLTAIFAGLLAAVAAVTLIKTLLAL